VELSKDLRQVVEVARIEAIDQLLAVEQSVEDGLRGLRLVRLLSLREQGD
jgi:hypothetical protein